MKLLFFDMEFANGQVKGSIYSIGYTVTDGDFCILTPPTDLLINPHCVWNRYVEENILAYPKEEVEGAPTFPERYVELSELFGSADLAVGFSVGNDLRALRAACKRYGLEMPAFRVLDTERLCRMMEEHREAHGLAGYVRAWCGEDPENQHRSDGDALATLCLLRAICNSKHVTPEMLTLAYPECCSDSTAREKRDRKPRRRARGHAPSKKSSKKKANPEKSNA